MLKFFSRWRLPPKQLLTEADALGLRPQTILLASEGRAFSSHLIALVSRFAIGAKSNVEILTIARIWGSGLGMPNPGLLPNSREWQEQRGNVANARAALLKSGIDAAAEVLAARNAAKQILRVAEAKNCDLIIMASDKPRHALISGLFWSQEPYRVRHLASLPVLLIPEA